MRVIALDTFIGSLIADAEGSILVKRLSSKIDVNELAERILKLESGEVTEEFVSSVEELVRMYGGEIEVVVPDEEHARVVSSLKLKAVVEPDNSVLRRLRDSLVQTVISEGVVKSEDEWVSFLNQVMLQVTRIKLRSFAAKRDLLAIQAIRSIDDIDKTINLFASRMREWYSVHFPELDDLIEDHKMYATIIYEFGDREEISLEKLRKLGFSESRATRIYEASRKSMGADLSEVDVERIRDFVGVILNLYELRDKLSEYLSQVMREAAPNITELVGPTLGARLLSLAGSLEDLAKMPASTIQVLGAEKALFRALRTGGRPPKHGVLFQHPEIHTAPKWQRGKISRAIATKLAIAAKADYFTGRFIADKLKKDLQERITEIKELYAKPPAKPVPEKVKGPEKPPIRRGKRGKGRR
ncbi:MAG: C/D box methylation guide ribonucleoprotein complex aNOP56 subunit [Desulfurococcaceae archaeon TW002]